MALKSFYCVNQVTKVCEVARQQSSQVICNQPRNTNSCVNAGFHVRQTLHQVILLSGCASPSAGVVFGLNGNVHILSGFQFTGLACLVEVTLRGRHTKQLQLLGSARPMVRARLFVRPAKVSCRRQATNFM